MTKSQMRSRADVSVSAIRASDPVRRSIFVVRTQPGFGKPATVRETAHHRHRQREHRPGDSCAATAATRRDHHRQPVSNRRRRQGRESGGGGGPGRRACQLRRQHRQGRFWRCRPERIAQRGDRHAPRCAQRDPTERRGAHPGGCPRRKPDRRRARIERRSPAEAYRGGHGRDSHGARHNVPVLLNPAPARLVPVSLLRQARFLTPNQSELCALTGLPTRRRREVETAARQLLALGASHVLATCGARGVCWCRATGTRWFPATEVKSVDTVGAGDCFSGAFATAIAEGKPVEEAIQFALTAAAISVTRPGAQPSMPTRQEIARFSHRVNC
ncbi:MAG: hypothetical protein DME19_14525 [Verrucomicrobia bacterium]|nr:MAG: hypothetical protein DME19_14525 [Verrucomicrobiota bacterium]